MGARGRTAVLALTGAFLIVCVFLAPAAGAASPKLETKAFAVPGNPSQVATGPDGLIYFTDVFQTYKSPGLPVGSGPIRALDPRSEKVSDYPQTVEDLGGSQGAPYDLAFDGDGNLWFTDPALQRIGKLTLSGPEAGRLDSYAVNLPQSGNLEDQTYLTQIILGPDGAMWFLDAGGDRLGRIDAGGTVTALTLPDSPRNIVSGPLDSIWASVGKQFLRISAGQQVSSFPSKPLGAGTLSASPKQDTLLSCSGKGLESIDKDGTVKPKKQKGCGQFQVLGPDGGLWASGGWYSGGVSPAHYVFRTSPRTGKTKSFRVGKEQSYVTGGSHQLAVSGKRLWMSDPSGRLFRISAP